MCGHDNDSIIRSLTWYSVDSITSPIATGLRMDASTGDADGSSCSMAFPAAIFLVDLKGEEPKNEDFLAPPPAGEPMIDEPLLELPGDPRKEACLMEEPMVEVIR